MTQKSSDQLFESLSALVDDEVSELELHRILKTVGSDEALRQRWARYNLIGAAIRREPIPELGLDISHAVSRALHDEPEMQSGVAEAAAGSDSDGSLRAAAKSAAWQGWLGKSAVAASVAVAFVFGFAQLQQTDAVGSASAPVIAANTAPVVEPSANLAAPLGFELPALEGRTVAATSGGPAVRSNVINPQPVVSGDNFSDVQSQELLNQLHILHAQRASANGGLGLLPFARVSRMDEVSGQ